jgi:hypothetical protein
MSIDSDVEVMRAKLAGAKGVPTLMQLASKGNMSAAIALKEIKDQEDTKAAMQREAGITAQAPEGSVLSGLAAEIEKQKAPMPTTQFAEGGRVRNFNGAEGSWNPDSEEEPKVGLSYGEQMQKLFGFFPDLLKNVVSAPGAKRPLFSRSSGDAAPATKPDFAVEAPGSSMPSRHDPAALAAAAEKPPTKPQAGLAAAAAAEAKPPEAPAKPETSALDKYVADLKALQDKGTELSKKEQAALDAAHAKSKERNKGEGFWGLMRAIGAQSGTHNGRRAIDSLGSGAAAFHESEKTRTATGDKEDQAYQTASLLIEKANNAAARGDLDTAYKLREQAAQHTSKMALEAAQTKHALASAEAEPVKAAAAKQAAGHAWVGAPGAEKPLTQYQKVAAQQRIRAEGIRLGKDGTELDAYVKSIYDKLPGVAATIPGNANPGANTGKTFQFSDI